MMTDIHVDIKPKVFNPAYLDFLTDPTRTQIFFGGSSSGKSVFLAQRAVYDVMDGRNYLVVRNTANTIRSSTFNEIKKVIDTWGLSSVFSINKSEMTITCQNNCQILFKGLDDTEKIKSVTPQTGVITDIWIEEATECAEDDIKQLEKRLRGKSKHPKRLILSFNPILKTHWIFKRYFAGWHDGDILKQTDDLLILKTTYKDNAFLEPDDIAALEGEKDTYWREVYTLGNWGVLGDVIFTDWRVEDLIKNQARRFDNIRNGLDFGFGPDPAAFTRLHYDATRNRVYIFQEVNGHELTNPDLADLIRPIVNRERVICDSAEPKSIAELRLLGINAIGAEKGPDSVHHGIQWLRQQEIVIDRQCQNVINEFQTYQWKKNRSGETLPIPVDRDNHHIDSIRYALEDCMNNRNEAIEVHTALPRATVSMFRGY
jgi:phage terminase large subunit